MKRSLLRKVSQRTVAALVVLSFLAAAAGIGAGPVRADATSVAVVTFQNDANAPSGVVESLSNALYRAAASSPNFVVKGGGPISVPKNQLGDQLADALHAAAAAGADHVLIGDVVADGAGSVTFRVAAYRIDPLNIVRAQVFTQPYPPADSQALVAALANDLSALEAPRAGTGTIYSVDNGKIQADLGSSEGFKMSERFNVLRNGQKLAEATIATQHDSYAEIQIENPTSGYKPAVGDRLVSQQAHAAVVPPPPQMSAGAWNPIAWILGAAAVLIAIGQKGAVGNFPSPSPTASSSTLFSVTGAQTGGSNTNPTFTFSFSQAVSSTDCLSVQNDTTRATATATIGGVTRPPTALSNLGFAGFDATCVTLTVMDTVSTYALANPGDKIAFQFTGVIMDTVGDTLTPNPTTITFVRTASSARRPLIATPTPKPISGSQQPGQPAGGGPKHPGGDTNPKGPSSGSGRPNPPQ